MRIQDHAGRVGCGSLVCWHWCGAGVLWRAVVLLLALCSSSVLVMISGPRSGGVGVVAA